MATCGWLISGSPYRAPNMPGLVMVNVPCWTSSGFSFFGPGASRQIVDGATQAEEILLVRVPDDGNDQSLIQRDSDPEVDVLLVNDVVPVDRRVDIRELAQRIDNHFGDEARVGELRARRFVVRFALLAKCRDPPEVDLVDGIHVRGGLRAQHHVLGDLLAHDAHRHDRDVLAGTIRRPWLGMSWPAGARRRGSRGCARLDEPEDVLLRHAPADASALDQLDIDVVLLRDAPDQGRGTLTPQRILRFRLGVVRGIRVVVIGFVATRLGACGRGVVAGSRRGRRSGRRPSPAGRRPSHRTHRQ